MSTDISTLKAKKGYAALNAGAWVGPFPDAKFWEGTELRVSRLWSPEFTKMHERLMAEMSGDLTDDQKSAKAWDECLVRCSVLGWRGPEVEGIEYTPEFALAVLSDPDAELSFRGLIGRALAELTKRVDESLKDAAKN